MAEQKTDKLLDKLGRKPQNSWDVLGDRGRKQARAFAEDYKAFIDEAKTERLAAAKIAQILEAAGFEDLDKGAAGPKVYQVYRGKTVAAARLEGKELDGLLMVGSHIDAPRLDLKGNPLYEDSNLALLKTHYYGGIKKYHWLARPLAMYGVVILADGRQVQISFGDADGEPALYIADLLPHLSQDQNKKRVPEAFTAENLNVLFGHSPFPETKGKDRIRLAVLEILNRRYGIVEEDLVSAELELVPAGKARDIGLDGDLIGAYGHDDRCCAYSSLRALLDARKAGRNLAALFFDKEEIGSEGNTGAVGRFMLDFAGELCRLKGDDSERKLRRLLASSEVLSADVSAALDPNFPEVHDKRNAALVGGGLVLTKYTGVRGKAGASDASAEFVGKIRRLFNKAKVVWQSAELGRTDLGGGGTIAKFVAMHGAEVLDCGPALLSMHSPCEVLSKADLFMTYKGYRTFFEKG